MIKEIRKNLKNEDHTLKKKGRMNI